MVAFEEGDEKDMQLSNFHLCYYFCGRQQRLIDLPEMANIGCALFCMQHCTAINHLFQYNKIKGINYFKGLTAF